MHNTPTTQFPNCLFILKSALLPTETFSISAIIALSTLTLIITLNVSALFQETEHYSDDNLSFAVYF